MGQTWHVLHSLVGFPVAIMFCICEPDRISALGEYSLLISFTATSRGITYKYDAEVGLHYTFPLFGWHDSTFDEGRSTRGRERLEPFLTKPSAYLERTRRLLLNQGSELVVRYDCFLGRASFRCIITQYRDEILIMKAILACGLQTSWTNYDACVPESVSAWGDGKRLLSLLSDGNLVKPDTGAFPDLFYDLSVAQQNLLRNSRPDELRVAAYVNSEMTTITCKVKSGLEVRFRIRCETDGSVPTFDDGRMTYVTSPKSNSVRYRTVEAYAIVEFNSTIVTIVRCTVSSSLGWTAVFEVTWRPRVNAYYGRGVPMLLKKQIGVGSGYTIPDAKTYENNMYKEVPYEYKPRRRYLGMTLGDLVSTIVLSALFCVFVVLVVFVRRRYVHLNVFSRNATDERSPRFPALSVKPDRKMTPAVNLEMSVIE